MNTERKTRPFNNNIKHFTVSVQATTFGGRSQTCVEVA
jgi:hypothetical protein